MMRRVNIFAVAFFAVVVRSVVSGLEDLGRKDAAENREGKGFGLGIGG